MSCAGYRLPTEAEWEYAARAGADQPYGHTADVDAAGWTVSNAKGRPHAVGEKQPNGWGLYDTVGNVWEWTADWYHRDGYAPLGEDATDPTGPETGSWRVLRGGSFMNLPSYCTCTHREPAGPERVAFTTGFRCAYPSP